MEGVEEEEESGVGACQAEEPDSNLCLAASNRETLGEASNGQVSFSHPQTYKQS